MSDPRTILAGVRERFVESLKDASHVVMFENMDAALADNPVMIAALTAVMDIHVSEPCEPECGQRNLCAACWDDYPCPTVQAITDALEVQG